jgi:hypothetical protein
MFETSAQKYDWIERIIAIGQVTECPTVPSTASLRFSDSLAAFHELPRKANRRRQKNSSRVSRRNEFLLFEGNKKGRDLQ